MKFGCTYIKVKDMEKSINFYEKLTVTQAKYSERKRWVGFPCGISLYCLDYDLHNINTKKFNESNYNHEYIKYIQEESTISSKSIVFNFITQDLEAERNRIINSGIGNVSEVMFVNITMPYYFFIVEDPDGNEIEITGPYNVK
ncbi:MAG: VOC family protein [Lachnotalea sp.]